MKELLSISGIVNHLAGGSIHRTRAYAGLKCVYPS